MVKFNAMTSQEFATYLYTQARIAPVNSNESIELQIQLDTIDIVIATVTAITLYKEKLNAADQSYYSSTLTYLNIIRDGIIDSIQG